MTTMYEDNLTCFICGKESSHTIIGSTNAFGSSDLDSRPPEMMRFTIEYQVQRCPSCGYCAPYLSEKIENKSTIMGIIERDVYQNQLHRSDYPKVANSFLCMALIHWEIGEYRTAVWSAIRAAWMCDDAHVEEAAKKCRISALDLMKKSQEKGRPFVASWQDHAVMVDFMRRAGKFEDAITAIDEAIQKYSDATANKIFLFQKELVLQNDTGRYLVSQVLGEE